MRILVTGAGGFVGRQFLHEPIAHGHEPVAGILKSESLHGVKTVSLDIFERNQVG